METSYMKLYKDIALRKNKIKSNKNSTQHLTKNKSLTYYHIEGKNNNLNNITDIKVNCSNNSGNQIIEYNKNYLLIAYKKGVLELFKALKSYMKKEVYKYNKIKNEFLQNIQKFYNEEKTKDKKIIKNNSSSKNYFNNIKSYSKKKIIKNGRKSNQLKENFLKNITSNISSQTQIINNNKNNLAFPFWPNEKTKNNIINNNNINNYHKNINKRNKINNNYNFYSFANHNSLYSIMKDNKLLGNSPMKCIENIKNNNIIKKFIKFSSNISKTKNKKINDENLTINDKNNENKKISERTAKNNDMILKIKDSLDDNLKHILNFSYENFLNKESERDCN